MDDFEIMLTLVGNNTLIKQTLRLKGIPFTELPGEQTVLRTRTMDLWDEDAIVHYLDERFPVPQLINGDIENRARIRMIRRLAESNPQLCDDLIQHADPFIFGDSITLVDLVVYNACKETSRNKQFKAFIDKVLRKSIANA